MISEFMFSKHLVLKYSNIFQTSVLMKRKKGGGGAGTHFKKEPGNQLMLVNLILACNQPLSVLRSARSDPEHDASSES